jgi:TRAP-type C4-dicarboxylate transport system substrate-binding protein
MFLRDRVESFADLQKRAIWTWNDDRVLHRQMELMGLHTVPAAIDQLSNMYDAGQIDGMFVIPTAALAFQWTTRARYFIDLRSSMLPGCLVLSQKAYDQLGFEQQQALTAAAARFAIRFEELGRREEGLLLGSMLEKIGVKKLVASASLRSAFLNAATRALATVDEKTLPRELLNQAVAILRQYRAQHAAH